MSLSIFYKNFIMIQAQIDLQTQLEQTSFDLTTQPLFNDFPVLFLEPLDQITTNPSDQIERVEHTTSLKIHTPPDNTHETKPPPKKRYGIMKYHLFFSPYIFPPTILSEPSFSTNFDNHLITLLSQDNFTLKAQLLSLFMHPTDYTHRLYDNNQEFSTSIASKVKFPYQY